MLVVWISSAPIIATPEICRGGVRIPASPGPTLRGLWPESQLLGRI